MNLTKKLIDALTDGTNEDVLSAFHDLINAPDLAAQLDAYQELEAAAKDAEIEINDSNWEAFK